MHENQVLNNPSCETPELVFSENLVVLAAIWMTLSLLYLSCLSGSSLIHKVTLR